MAQLIKLIQENKNLKNTLKQYQEVYGCCPHLDDSLLKGGYRVVNNITERDAIPCCYRKQGMVVMVIEDTEPYTEYYLDTTTCDNVWVKIEDSGIEETDPTVPAWAKQPTKPSYTYGEISGTPILAPVAITGDYNDLINQPTLNFIPLSSISVPNGVASLNSLGVIPNSQLPPLAITSVFTAVSEIAHLALNTEEGDVVVRTDLNKTFIKNNGTSGTMSDWQEMLTPTDSVISVNGQTGVVSLAFSDLTSHPNTLSGYGITDAVPSNRTITINGVSQNLSANRTWTIPVGPTYTEGDGIDITGNVISVDSSVVGKRVILPITEDVTLPQIAGSRPTQTPFAPIELFDTCPAVDPGWIDWEIVWQIGDVYYKLSALGDYNVYLSTGGGCFEISGQTMSTDTYVVHSTLSPNPAYLILYY